VQQAIDIANAYALTASPANLAKMEEAFLKTSQLEYMFWDSAYQQEGWKI
jgi:thiaminase/transcriptional activator TenA